MLIKLPEAACLRTRNPDPVCLTVLADLLLGDAIPCRDGKGLIAGDGFTYAGALKRLCNLIRVHMPPGFPCS